MGRVNDMPTTWEECARLGERTLANNTTLRMVGVENGHSVWAIRLHQTDIVTFHPEDANGITGVVTLNSGGWQTVTTKRRMNACLRSQGWRVCQTKGIWSVWSWIAKRDIEYTDGMTLGMV